MTYAGLRGRVALGATGLLLGGTLAGCGSDSPADPGATDGATPTPSATTVTTTSTSPTAEASATGVPPATGPLITLNNFTVHAPAGWQVLNGDDPERNQANDPSQPVGTLLLSSYQDIGDLGMDFELEQATQAARSLFGPGATRQPDRTVDGVSGYVFSGSSSGYPTFYRFSTVHDHYVATVAFTINVTLEDPQAFVDAVLNSLTFTTPPPPS